MRRLPARADGSTNDARRLAAVVMFGAACLAPVRAEALGNHEVVPSNVPVVRPAGAPPPCTPGGETFNDVPASNPFCPWIEELARRGVTAGCGGGAYCPGVAVNRGQMAVFLLRALEGSGYVPPNCSGGAELFSDVPASHPFCQWIQDLAMRGVTSGCSATQYCPGAPVTRGQMAVFLLRTLEGPGYLPPGCVAGQTSFFDVPANTAFCPWIEELANRGVTSGCGFGQYCPGTAVNRGQMAVFLLRTFVPGLVIASVTAAELDSVPEAVTTSAAESGPEPEPVATSAPDSVPDDSAPDTTREPEATTVDTSTPDSVPDSSVPPPTAPNTEPSPTSAPVSTVADTSG